MAKLPWFSFILAGTLLAGVSWYLEQTRNAKLGVFFVAGLIFLGIGAFRLVLKIILSGDRKILRPQERGERQHAALVRRGSHVFCPACRTANHRSNRFCRMCGYPLWRVPR
ncbi:zinc ribbon domain-containing protein [Candidatus Woesearchaeota archaeon]|nr:MAG: zinc ribbon domain-containing protein [Candidatus Woesearchaeota archaeon]